MKNLLNRALVVALAILSLAAAVPQAASADTGPWQWSDISDKLIVTSNRPVWAIARAEPYWYLTDGQELWSGGHVWRTDGTVMSDITLEVRNAGISRVDDIVSDGQSVIYLKNITSGTRNFEALAYRNGSYSSPVSLWQQYINSDEGLSSITGKDGNWMIVTNHGKVLNWNQVNNQISQLSLPNNPSYLSYSPQIYSTRHVSPADGNTSFIVTQAVPTSNGWIIAVPQTSGNSWRVYQYNNGSYSDLTSQVSGLYNIQTLASNGNQVLLVGGDTSYASNRAYSIENGYVKTLYNLPSIAWNKSIVGYNGKSWMIISNKDLVRFDGTNFQTYGQTRDYFVQTIGSGSGTYLLGGAVSSNGLGTPSSPLTAKLVRVDEGTSYTSPSVPIVTTNYTYSNEKVGTVNGMKNRITYWAWLNPSYRYQASNTKPTYTVGAQSNDGIKRIELYINDVYQKTCYPGNTKKNTQCSMTIDPAAWPLVSNVGSFAKITSGTNRVAYVPASIISFYDNSVSANMTVDNNTPYLVRGSSTNVTISGNAGNGINRIEIYVNGAVKQTCNLNNVTYGTCSVALNGNDYTVGSGVAFNGRVIASNGQEAWSWLGNYTVTDYNSNYNYNQNNYTGTNGNLSAWAWTSPTGNDFSTSDSKTIMSQANAGDGLQTIEIIVKGTVKQTCSFSRAYGTQACQVSIYGSNYSNSTQIPVYVRATDYYGRQATSQTLYLNTNYNSNSNSLSTWIDSSGTSNLGYNETRSVSFSGSSGNGLRQLDLYANDSLIGTCTYSDISNSTQTCSRSIYGSNYSQGTYVTLKSKATDRYGYTVWSTTNPQIYITSNGSNNNTNGTVTLSTTGDRTSYGRNETFSLNAYANDSDGIRRIDLYANNVLVNSCTISNTTYGSCSASVLGSNYTGSSMSLPLQAKVTDSNYNTIWSNTKYVQIDNYNNNNNYNTTVTFSYSPNQTSFQRNQTFTVTANATDGNGIQKMEIYANSSLVQTCNSSYGTSASCSASITGSSYSNLNSLPIQVRVTDNNSQATWSDTQYIQLTDSNSNTNTNPTQSDVKGTLTISSDADNGYTSGQNITFTANGTDDNGIERIEVYVNASLVKTCYGATTCSYTGGPYTYNSLTYAAKMTDLLGNSIWNGYKTIYKK
ncbi:MAG: Ig-like domain-containing protein [Patescibacteria group bacterium]|nr:Ig-like domain-containing protein [Patescibacteria group bacterium]